MLGLTSVTDLPRPTTPRSCAPRCQPAHRNCRYWYLPGHRIPRLPAKGGRTIARADPPQVPDWPSLWGPMTNRQPKDAGQSSGRRQKHSARFNERGNQAPQLATQPRVAHARGTAAVRERTDSRDDRAADEQAAVGTTGYLGSSCLPVTKNTRRRATETAWSANRS